MAAEPPASLTIEAIRPRRLYQQVAEQIERLIESGTFKPGDQLPAEVELSKRFAVSRPTIREAMIVLETAGLIEVLNGHGTFVRPQEISRRPAPARPVDQGPGPYEQFEARELIECEVAARAAERATPEVIAQLEDLVRQMEVNYPRNKLADAEGFQFHVTLAKASGNSVFAGLVEELWRMRENDMWTTMRSRLLKAGHRQHAIGCRHELVAAMKRRDGEGARAAMRRMLDHARALYFDV
jgi:DNA-binding FadR family transcriptional regulator